MKKITKALLAIAGMAIIAAIGYMAGARMEIRRQAEERNRRENIAAIAVVNMDDGVVREGEHRNYAGQLMFFPDANFVSAGLNDAKAGIQNGSYAAYIIIPESFSVSVTSIENNPRKVALEYAYNPNLSEEAKIQAVQNIHNFKAALNANIAYMYIDAVLSAFHEIQDDSEEILTNDIKEMKLLQSVDAAKLIASVERPELIVVEADIQPIELASYTQQNRSFLEGMSVDYAVTLQKGREGYLEVQNKNQEVAEATEDFFALYQSIVAEAAKVQDDILQEGQKNVKKGIGLYNGEMVTNQDAIRRQLSMMIEKQLAADQSSAQKQLDEILQDIDNAKLQSKWEDAYQGVQGYVQRSINEQAESWTEDYCALLMDGLKTLARNSYLQGTKDALQIAGASNVGEDYQKNLEKMPKEDFVTVSGNDIILTVSGNSLVFDSSGEDGLLPDYQDNSIAIDWDNPTDEKGRPIKMPAAEMAGSKGYAISLTIGSECGKAAVAEAVEWVVEELSLEKNAENLSDILQKELAEPILSNNLMQMENLNDSQAALGEKILSYENRLFAFDPIVYLEQANLNAYLNDIAGNTENMMGAVSANNAEYASYATDADRATSRNMANLQAALNDAQAQTASNVETSIGSIIESRENTNAQNVSLLEGFTKLLAYTRVKSQGNPEVYDYIVNPVVASDDSAIMGVSAGAANQNRASPDGRALSGQSLKGVGEFLLGMAIAICIAIIAAGACRKYSSRSRGDMAEEPEEVF